jgi:E3 ubiquitin-protein ligase CCNP1IP1
LPAVFGFLLGNSSQFALENTPVVNQGGGDKKCSVQTIVFVASLTALDPINHFFSFGSQSYEGEQQLCSTAFKAKRS